MTAVQWPPPPLASSNGAAAFGSSKGVGDALDRFPAGLRVMVVDDDTTCLKILEQMLRKCEYNVTTCSRATSALSLLRERKGHFDLVISDVHMPDMDGLKLLELIGLEMDLPVIMMSADSRTSMVMKGIKHGACDYLIKPVRFEELRNVWQHVARKKWNDHKDHEQSGAVGESERHRQGADDVEYTLQSNDIADGSGTTTQKKKRDAKEDPDDGDLENDDASTSKKPRVVWSVELHQQFVNAVNQLGIDRAVPKRILELMNVRGLTRENVASHLQKYRLYLKRISGVAQQHGGLSNYFSGAMEANARTAPFGRLDIQSLVASGQIPPQALVAQHAGSLGRPSIGTGGLPSLDQTVIHASLQGPKCIPAECSPFGHRLTEFQPGITRQTNIAVGDMPSEFGTWTSNHLIRMGNTNVSGPASSEDGNTSARVLQQQSNQSILGETNHANNTQLSSLVSASQSSTNFHTGNSTMPIRESMLLFPPPQASHNVPARNVLNLHLSFCNNSIVLGQNPTYSQPNCVQGDTERVVDDDLDAFLSGCSIPVSASSAVPSCSFPSDGSIGWKAVTSDFSSNPPTKLPSSAPVLGDMQNCSSKMLPLPDQGHGRNLGFVGKGTCIPSRFAVDDMKPLVDNQSQTNSSTLDEVSKVKTRDLPGFDGRVCSRQPALCHHTPK